MKKSILLILNLLIIVSCFSQEIKELRLNLNADKSHYLKATVLNQIWLKYNQNNPGSQQYGFDKSNSFDIGIRRLRFQLYGQLTDKVFFYTQFGQNNFSVSSPRFTGAFFHDGLIEYKVKDRYLSIGTGLSSYNGYLRFSSPGVGAILGADAPLYQQATNSVTDQFLRKLSIYAKGKISKLDYRIILSTPMAAQNGSPAVPAIGATSNFSLMPPKLQYQGYFMWQFLDEESNTTPFMTGNYLGSKKVFNVGAGFILQDDATWHLSGSNDTVSTSMTLLGIDVFIDRPLNIETGAAISAYGAFSSSYFGPNYLRMANPMNIATGLNNQGTITGPGNNFPMIGTGTTLYGQVGFKFKNDLLPNNGTIQPYASIQHSKFESLSTAMNVYECGINWLIHGTHAAKLTLGLQNRPVFEQKGDLKVSSIRRNQVVMQWQVAF